ncbi:hypothetical protein [Sphingomonas xinjiangensis]|uniref:Uncharacterized protein n=1 Tax=Sphingomonas xinjiangensis TaxID=643568 RepID=A0A840YSH9_9SPHN|nr:hypothetical protein [Sphingomonas xinjiangensis]MBB5712627.1 hypothetical protein [Sphingomonas xinjiangensis]
MAKTLAQFTITPSGDAEYRLHLEDDEGETLEFTAQYDQLDLIVDAINEQLNNDEGDALAVDADEADENEV